MKQKIIELIFEAIQTSSFEDWHKGKFEDFITGERNIPSEEIKKDIERLFHLGDLGL